MDDSDPIPEDCKKLLRELFGTLNHQSHALTSACQGYAKMIKHLIEKGQSPTDEQLVVMMDSILKHVQTHREFMDEVKSDLSS